MFVWPRTNTHIRGVSHPLKQKHKSLFVVYILPPCVYLELLGSSGSVNVAAFGSHLDS